MEFPIAIPAWKIAPALAHGNTVVLKPSEITPASAYHLTKIMEEAGLPAGVFNFAGREGEAVGETLVSIQQWLGFRFWFCSNRAKNSTRCYTAYEEDYWKWW